MIESWDVEPMFSFTPSVPEGGSIALDEETGGVIISDSEGYTSSVLGAPWAFDADGTKVPTWYEVEDGAVYQYVDHISRQFAYPVVADPVWFVPVLMFVGRIVIKEIMSATFAAAVSKAVSGVGTVAKHRSWTNANKRFNLIISMTKDPGSRCEAHHTLPQKFSAYFAGRGFTGNDSIHHPKYLVWWEKTDHRSRASAVNNMWSKWISVNSNASKAKVLAERTLVLRTYPPKC